MRLSGLLSLIVGVVALCSLGCSDGAGPDSGSNSPTVTVRVAPLDTTAPFGVVCYDLRVATAEGTLWTKGEQPLTRDQGDTDTVCSDESGNGPGGSVTYIGPCDAAVAADTDPVADGVQNAATLWFDGVYDVEGDLYISRAGWYDPCGAGGCTLHFACLANADTIAEFNFTVFRDADQGFFDIAVRFENIYCSAKLDSCYGSELTSDPIEQVFGADGEPDWSAVLAISCAGPAGNPINLHYGQIAVQCDGGDDGDPTAFLIDPTISLGGVATDGNATLHYSVSRGVTTPPCDDESTEPIEVCSGLYWNIALDLVDLALLGTCTLTTSATATNGNTPFVDGLPAQSGVSYPYIDVFDVVLTTLEGPFCQQNPLNGASGYVATAYHGDFTSPAQPMCFTLDEGNNASAGFNGVHADCDLVPPGLPGGKFLPAYTPPCNLSEEDRGPPLNWTATDHANPIECDPDERCIPGGGYGHGLCVPATARLCTGQAEDDCTQALVQLSLTRPEDNDPPVANAPSLGMLTIPRDSLVFGTLGPTGAIATLAVDAGGSGYFVGDLLTIDTGGGDAAVYVQSVVGPVSSIGVAARGSGYAVDDTLTIIGGNSDATVNVDQVSADGPVSIAVVNAGGSGYAVDDVLTIQAGGNDATVNVDTIGPGPVSTAVVNAGGSGYSFGDTLTIDGGNDDAIVTVDTVDASGAVTGLSLTSPGTGYSTASGQTTTGGSGIGCTVDVTAVGPVTAVSIVAGGSGYTDATGVTTAGGFGAGCTVDVTAAIGGVLATSIIDAGSGYTTASGAGTSGGSGTGCTLDVSVNEGAVDTVAITSGGTGYVPGPGQTTLAQSGVGTGCTFEVLTIEAVGPGNEGEQWFIATQDITFDVNVTTAVFDAMSYYDGESGGAAGNVAANTITYLHSVFTVPEYAGWTVNNPAPASGGSNQVVYCERGAGPELPPVGVCTPTGTTMSCDPQSRIATCPAGSYCDNGPFATNMKGKCRRKAADEVPCAVDAGFPWIDPCDDGLRCIPDPYDYYGQVACRPPGGEGAPCNLSWIGEEQCQPELYCRPQGNDFATCAPRDELGERCAVDVMPEPQYPGHTETCMPGLVCEPSDYNNPSAPHYCVDPGPGRPDGEPCWTSFSDVRSAFECEGHCEPYSFFGASPPGAADNEGICKADYGLGERCLADTPSLTSAKYGGFCKPGLFCNTAAVPPGTSRTSAEGTCQPIADIGCWCDPSSDLGAFVGHGFCPAGQVCGNEIHLLSADYDITYCVEAGCGNRVVEYETQTASDAGPSLYVPLIGVPTRDGPVLVLTEGFEVALSYFQPPETVKVIFYVPEPTAPFIWEVRTLTSISNDISGVIDDLLAVLYPSYTNRGTWSDTTTYGAQDIVEHDGLWYMSGGSPVVGVSPDTSGSGWSPFPDDTLVTLSGALPTSEYAFSAAMVPLDYEECDDGDYNCDDQFGGTFTCGCSSLCMLNPTSN